MTAPAQFKRVLAAGRRAALPSLTVVASPTAGESRLGIVASRRVGTAVARNRAKRLLREAARAAGVRPGMDVVLLASATTAKQSLHSVLADLRNGLSRVGAAC